jgi:hypothetical protein
MRRKVKEKVTCPIASLNFLLSHRRFPAKTALKIFRVFGFKSRLATGFQVLLRNHVAATCSFNSEAKERARREETDAQSTSTSAQDWGLSHNLETASITMIF